ncbi:MAG: PPC domain-containing protein [Bryobacterales bacterium]|nr:PPC domain-containing protein [Bryobacterales bacterium]
MKTAALLIFTAAALTAAPPLIRDLSVHGAQRGKTLKLVLKGAGLTPGAKLETTLPAAISRLTPEPGMKPGATLPFLVELHKDAPVGVYPLRIHSAADGLSNVMLFSVGALADVAEKEADDPEKPNGVIATAETLPGLPVTVNGTLPGSDVDIYAFTAKPGQQIVFEAEANVLGSAIDPALEILDAAGKTIARNDDAPGAGIDARLEVTFPRAGAYYVRVHDSKYADQAQNFYRLKIGGYSFAEAIFPIGGRRGMPAKVELVGGNLAAPVTVPVAAGAAGRFAFAALPGSPSLPHLFLLSDQPDTLESPAHRTLTPGVVVNGRIAAKGEKDSYTLAVKPGEQWLFEVVASSTGASQLDALVTVANADGKKLVSRDDLFGADPTIPLEVPEGVKELRVTIEDLLGRGGPAFGYRLEARREAADFTLQLATPYVNIPAGGTAIVNVNIARRGYDGAMQILIPNLPKGYRQAGGTVAPAAASQRFDDPNPRFGRNTATITITAEADAPPLRADLAVKGVADLPGGGRIVRFAGGPGLVVTPRGLKQKTVTASWLDLPLAAASAKALPARVTTPVQNVRVAQGVEYPFTYKIEGAAAARTQGRLRQNVATQIGNLRILQGPPSKTPGTGSLLVNTNFATPTTPWDFLPLVTVDVDGEPTDIYAPMVTFDTVPGYQVWPAARVWTAAPSFTIAGEVHREPTFEGGLVKIEAQDLPDSITCAAIEVPAEQRDFSLACQSTPAAPKGAHEIRLVSSAPDTGRKAKDTYKGPEVTGTLKVN